MVSTPIIDRNPLSTSLFACVCVYRAQITGGQETHAEDADQGILAGLVHVAKEIRASDIIDNASGRRREVAPVLRVGQHGGNIETSKQ